MYILLYVLVLFFIPFIKSDITEFPPGTIQLERNFFVDKYEITNKEYRFYLQWLHSMGVDCLTIAEAIPKISSIQSFQKNIRATAFDYFIQDDYELYPVVGITREQAQTFCEVKSNVIRKGLTQADSLYAARIPPRHFLYKKYRKMNAEIKLIPSDTHNLFPLYRLPTPDEWDKIARHEAVKKSYHRNLEYIAFTYTKAIFNLFDNVSEYTSHPGIVKGGNFQTGHKNLPPDKIIQHTGPANWIGFRCVCSMEK